MPEKLSLWDGERGAADPTFVSHAWYPDTVDQTTDYDVYATIQSASGVADATVYWSTDPDAGYEPIAMTNTANDEYYPAIPGQPYGTRVHYYVEAISNGVKTIQKPIVASDWAYNFLVREPTVVAHDDSDSSVARQGVWLSQNIQILSTRLRQSNTMFLLGLW